MPKFGPSFQIGTLAETLKPVAEIPRYMQYDKLLDEAEWFRTFPAYHDYVVTAAGGLFFDGWPPGVAFTKSRKEAEARYLKRALPLVRNSYLAHYVGNREGDSAADPVPSIDGKSVGDFSHRFWLMTFKASAALYRACCALPAEWWLSDEPAPVDDMLAFARQLTEIPDDLADELWLDCAEALALAMREADGGVRAEDVVHWAPPVLKTEAEMLDLTRQWLRETGAGQKPALPDHLLPPAEAESDAEPAQDGVEIPSPVRAPVRKTASRRKYSKDVPLDEIDLASVDAALRTGSGATVVFNGRRCRYRITARIHEHERFGETFSICGQIGTPTGGWGTMFVVDGTDREKVVVQFGVEASRRFDVGKKKLAAWVAERQAMVAGIRCYNDRRTGAAEDDAVFVRAYDDSYYLKPMLFPPSAHVALALHVPVEYPTAPPDPLVFTSSIPDFDPERTDYKFGDLCIKDDGMMYQYANASGVHGGEHEPMQWWGPYERFDGLVDPRYPKKTD